MEITDILDFVKPGLVILIPALYIIGMGLKKWGAVKDNWIPVILGACGIVLAAIWVLASSDITGYKDVLMAVFTAIVQGVLVAGLSVYVNQIWKQVIAKSSTK